MAERFSELIKSTDISKYDISHLKQLNTKYKLAIGERGNGKTYAVKMEIINNFILNPTKKFIYLRRKTEQIARKEMKRLFSDINDYAMKRTILGDAIKYGVDSGFYILDDNDKFVTLGYPMSVEDGAVKKGIPWNDVNLVLFDEFLEYGNELEDEISKFLNVISTVCRDRNDITIYMLANTVTKYSKYFDLFGIDVAKIKQGHIYTFYHKGGVSGAIEWCKSAHIAVDGARKSHPYIGFDNNPTASMILYGEWEYNAVNTKSIDGIGWSCQRKLFPCYVTALYECYELSLYMSRNPIVFIRKVNVQKGECNKHIKYNISYDLSIDLVNKYGIIPRYSTVSSLLMGNEIATLWKYIMECIKTKRMVCDKIESGSDFLKIYPYIKG